MKSIKHALTGCAAIAMFTASGTAIAQDTSTQNIQPTPDRAATEQILLDHITILASDEYAGRMPGTEGGRMAQEYMVRALESYGYEPGYQGEWRQPVALVGTGEATAQLKIGGDTISGDDIAAYSVPGASVTLADRELVMVSTPSEIPSDMTGKIALLPNLGAAQPLFAPLVEAGAAGVVILIEDEAMFARFAGGPGRIQWSLAPDGDAQDDAEPAVVMVGPGKAAALRSFVEENAGPTITLTGTSAMQRADSANVVGLLRGTEPGSGAIVMMGHWDHLGTCGDEGDEDRICNGAADNASGIAAILETAKRLAQGPRPKRDIYIMGTTAEEMGLLGAQYFAENPPIPLDQFQAALNIDMISIAPAGLPLTVIGWNQTPMDAPIQLAADSLGRRIEVGEESARYVRRQDGWALMNLGVPATLVSSGFGDEEILNAFMDSRYHRANDEVHDGLALGGAAEDVPLYTVLMLTLANPNRYNKPAGWEFDRGE